MSTPPSTAPLAEHHSGSGEKGLRSNALGLFSSTAIGLASAAPAYSLAAALGLIVAGVGLQAPIVTILAFIPMLLIAYAYKAMNEVDPDCGTTFTWAARAFGPRSGWMGGWGIVVADIICMANLAQIAGTYTFQLFGFPGLATDVTWATVAGVVWIVLMTLVCYLGIEVSANLQKVLLCFEVAMLAIFSVTALVRAYSAGSAAKGSIHLSAAWFNPFDVSSVSALTTGILAAIFIYWGWDTAASVNEETVDKTRTPGRAGVIATGLLLLIYTLVATSAQAFAGVGDKDNGLGNSDNSGDVLSGLGGAVFGTAGFGWFMAKLFILTVLTSAAASTQTTILPTARTTFSMAAHKALPSHFARVHPRFRTPTWSTVAMGAVSIAFYVLLTKVSTNVLTDSISSVGLAIAFYYGLTGLACVWYFRKVLGRSAHDLWMKGILPGLGGLLLLFFFCYAAFHVYADPGYGNTTIDLPLLGRTGGVTVIGIAALLLGAVLMVVQEILQGSWFRTPDVPVAAYPADPTALRPDGADAELTPSF